MTGRSRILAQSLVLLILAVLPAGAKAAHIFGDWAAGAKQDGISLGLSYTGELASNVSGGRTTGTAYAGQLQLKMGINWQRIAGLKGLSTHIDVVNRHGNDLSSEVIGDHLLHAQEIYGGGGDVLVHLAYAFMRQKLDHSRIIIAAGRLPVMTDFGTLSKGCDFMSLTICATRGLDANLGWTSFPRATWGGSLRVKLAGDITAGTGLYEVNPLTGGRSGFHWSLKHATGIMVPLEIDWSPHFGKDLTGKYKLGGYVDTNQFPEWNTAINGRPLYITSLPAKRTARGGFYLLAQQQVSTAMTVLAGYVYNTADTSLFQHFAFVGLLDKGLVAGRPNDRAGLEFTYARVSSRVTDLQEGQLALGQSLANGAPGVQTDEMLIEADYSLQAARGVKLMPDLQYVIRPDAAPTYANAVVLGLQVKATF